MATAAATATLELREVFKSFGSVQALRGVDFEVRDGEVMALVGDNGAGKSTLIKCVAGIYSTDGGEIFFDGEPVTIHGPKDAAKLGIEVIYQDLALCDNLDVVQNMYLGREERDPIFRLREAPMEQRTTETLKSLAVTTIRSVRQPVATLSGGQRHSAAAEDAGFAALLRARWEAFKGGDVGSLPVIIGIIAITAYFTSTTSIFFSAVNFSNLIGQMAGVTVIAVGVVFVLLIGEIDLSIGYVSGIAGVVVAELQLPGSGHQWPGLVASACAIAAGAAIRAVQGSFVAGIGGPSLLVTLAGLLIWQGVILKDLGTQGVIGIQDRQINDVANYVLTKNTGWVIAIVFTAGLAVA